MNPSMPHLRQLASCGAMLLGLLSHVRGQDAATTLSGLIDNADGIAQVHANSGPQTSADGATHSIQLRVVQSWRGALGSALRLSEPAGRCCGRALHALPAGEYLVFLRRAGSGWQLAASGARALVAADPAVLTFARAWRAATDDAGRLDLLLDAVGSQHARVRRDAAMELPRLARPQLAGPLARREIAAALRASLDQPAAHTTPPLLRAAARLQLTECVGDVVRAYLHGRADALRPLLRAAVLEIDAAAAAAAVGRHLARDSRGTAHAVELLGRVRAPTAEAPLRHLLRTGQPDVVFAAAVALLRHHGADAARLRGFLPADRLADAERAAQGPVLPKWRVVRPPHTTGMQ